MAGQADGFLHDVYDAGMGASRKKYGLTVFFYQQALFVTEIVVYVWSRTEQQSVAGGAETVAGYVSKEEDTLAKRRIPLSIETTSSQLIKRSLPFSFGLRPM